MNYLLIKRFLLVWLAASCITFPAQGQDILTGAKSSGLDTSLLAPSDEFLPVDRAFKLTPRIDGQQLTLTWKVADHYYLYEERFKFSSDSATISQPVFSSGITKYDEFFSKDMTVFYDQVTVTLDITHTEPFTLTIESQGCADAGLCYPPYTQVVQVDPAAQTAEEIAVTDSIQPSSTPAPDISVAPAHKPLWLLILFAMLGGAILNLMPCVFPVLSIKIMSLAQADRERLPIHGWVYTAGIVLCFVLFASILLVARAGGEAIGWGFQLQSPLLITALVYLFFIMGLSLSGMVNIGTSWMGVGQALTQKSGLKGSFFTGVLAAVVASPCTAPFMGAALGFALTQPGIVSLSVFAALGFGMALPLLLLCYIPALASRLPRPGAWMETFKEILAFPLYLTAVWLLWVLGRQAGLNTLIIVCAGAVAIAFSFWLMGRPGRGIWQFVRRLLIVAAWVIAIAMPWQALKSSSEESRWQAYSPELLQKLRDEGTPVFVNLTADWCLTCLANERLALSTEEVEAAFDAQGVIALKGDWTNTDPTITALLNEYGRSGVPLYLWFPPNSQVADVLPQLLTRTIVVEAINKRL
jgi:thiol:disulfide interchange protein